MRKKSYIVKGMLYNDKKYIPEVRYFSKLIVARTSWGAMIKASREIVDTYEDLLNKGYKLKFADLEARRCIDES